MPSKAPKNQAEIHGLMDTNPFDGSLVEKFEKYVSDQAANGTYDFKANRHLLQLYNLATAQDKDSSRTKVEAVEKILLLALTQLPQPHFLACTYLVHGKMHNVESIKRISELRARLESGNFPKFWAELSDGKTKALVSKVAGFEQAMQRFVASTIEDVYQTIAVPDLKKFLNIKDDAKLSAFLKEIGWNAELRGDKKGSKKDKNAVASVSVPLGPGNQFVPASTTEKLSLDNVSMVLEVLSAR